VSLAFVLQELVPRVSGVSISNAGTLPTREITRDGVLGEVIDEREVESFLASTFGGEVRAFSRAPEARVIVTNRSGVAGLERWYVERLVGYGAPVELLSTREGEVDSYPSRVVTTVTHLSDADYYAGMLDMGRQQIARFTSGVADADIEIVLGADLPIPPGFVPVQAATSD